MAHIKYALRVTAREIFQEMLSTDAGIAAAMDLNSSRAAKTGQKYSIDFSAEGHILRDQEGAAVSSLSKILKIENQGGD
jgi:hypothetical protein